jgi:hypothetical protein
MYAIITHHDAVYKPLADLTWDDNKVHYAKKHGYALHARTDNFVTAGQSKYAMTGFEKIHLALSTLEEHPEYEWIWWTGTDTMITNFSTRIEDRVNNAYHFIVCVDVNGINADSFLVRNTTEGKDFLKSILSFEEEYLAKYWDTEQRAIANLLGFPGTGDTTWPYGDAVVVNDKYKDVVKVMPQRYMNSFNYMLYPQYTVPRDKLDFDGNWQLGDWLIHWPACDVNYRIQLYNFYKEYIIK